MSGAGNSVYVETERGNWYNSGKISCLPVEYEGVHYFVRVVRPPGINMRTVRNGLISQLQLYDPSTFPGAPDGIYTWIVSDRGFFAIRVLSQLELGTLHKQLADRSGSTYITVAGECLKIGRDIKYNTASGTYTRPLIDDAKITNAGIRAKAHTVFSEMRLDATDTQSEIETYISKAYLPVTSDELLMYKRAGYDVLLYADKAGCDTRMLQLFKARLGVFDRSRKGVVDSDSPERKELEAQIAKYSVGPTRILGGRRFTRKSRTRRVRK
jgi:hypothetical protein